MAGKFNVLVLGASYGSLLGTKLGLAGHDTHLICLPAEADLINNEGASCEFRSRDATGWSR